MQQNVLFAAKILMVGSSIYLEQHCAPTCDLFQSLYTPGNSKDVEGCDKDATTATSDYNTVETTCHTI